MSAETPNATIRLRSEFRNSSPPAEYARANGNAPGRCEMAAATKPALSLKGTGIVFVGSRGADIKGPSRRGAGVYAWDTRHVSSYEVRPTAGSLRLRSAEILPDGALLRYSLGPLQISRRIRVENSIEDQWSI